MSSSRIDVSVIVAAYNESEIIVENLGEIVCQLNSRPSVRWELICVNDGSDDNTGTLLEFFKCSHPHVSVIHHRHNYGQGRALRSGFDISRGQVIVTLDADLSYRPEYIYRLVDALDERCVDIALASAYMKGGNVRNVPPLRHLLSRFGNYYLARMTAQRISTSTCVVRAYQREVWETLIFTSDGMDLQLEVLAKARMMGFRIAEIPAQLAWSPHKTTRSGVRRISKVHVLSTAFTYLQFGWLQRPASALFVLSWLLILPGLYMALTVAIAAIDLWLKNLAFGFSQSLTITLKQVVLTYSQNIAFTAAFLGFGVLIFAFSLILLQNIKYYDELSRMILLSKKRTMTNSQDEDRV
jgi:glycosyltransferase involved in cell wall biosynthesis